MKICAIICEFNPFHNGHEYLFRQAKAITGCDYLICIMSGSFTQRGELCIMDKFTRAKHAVLCDADAVLELPAAFAAAPAEIFSEGAIKILSSIPDMEYLAFGCENADADFFGAADILLNESDTFKKILKENLDLGESYIKSLCGAFTACGGQTELLSKPNNILAVEYAKAIIKLKSKIKILPIKRLGGDYNSAELKSGYSSARAIRCNLFDEKVKQNVPACVYADIKNCQNREDFYNRLLAFAAVYAGKEDIKRVYGCTEGLENKLLADLSRPGAINALRGGKRYADARIRRILLANLLKIYSDDVQNYLRGELYIKPLAIKKDRADGILGLLSAACYPAILKKRNLELLSKTAQNCYETDIFASKIYDFIFERPIEDFDYPIFV